MPYGRHIAKLDLGWIDGLADRPDGRLVLVTAITPTPAGEGKTTTTVGLGDGLNRIGKKAVIALREPSLGPCFGMKGGAAGGGYAQVVPMEQINLHFTGDFHAIGSAHNLLSAMLDNHIYWGNGLGIDERRIAWRRVIDMNDRSLRQIVSGLGGVANGFPREDGFDITVASEVMAVFCLATDLADLERRLGRMIVGYTRERKPVTAADLEASGAMTVLLKDALAPNLVQTLEGNPAFVHGGPFANIAHGCNSVMATRTALKLGEYVVTEAGFGADLGAEKFFDIKCRKAGLSPAAAVIVATVRALKMHGGVAKADLGAENLAALQKGMANLDRHVRNVRQLRRAGGGGDQPLLHRHRGRARAGPGALPARARHRGPGLRALGQGLGRDRGAGPARGLALRGAARAGRAGLQPPLPRRGPALGQDADHRAARSTVPRTSSPTSGCATSSRRYQAAGYGHFPICVAKTQYSFSTDAERKGAPSGHVVPIRELRLAGGAEFLVVVCGEIMTMPGLPKVPAAAAHPPRRAAAWSKACSEPAWNRRVHGALETTMHDSPFLGFRVRAAIAAGALLVTGCSSDPQVTTGPTANPNAARDLLVATAAQGPVPLVVDTAPPDFPGGALADRGHGQQCSGVAGRQLHARCAPAAD